jgi:hypothetical protein
MTPKPLSRAEQSKLDREKLSLFIRHIKHYKIMWGLSPDRMVFLSTWARVRRECHEQETGANGTTVLPFDCGGGAR